MNHLFNSIGRNISGSGIYLSRFSLLACLCTLLFQSCRQELVNMENPKIKEFSIVLPNEVSTLVRGVADADSVIPKLSLPGKAITAFDSNAYSFTWVRLPNMDTISTRSYLTYRDFDKYDPTLFSSLLTVKEKATGIVKYATTTVFITTPTREGWILLGDQAGTAKLSILTYSSQGYKKYVDPKTELGMDFQINGKPVGLRALGSDKQIGQAIYQWVGITTDQEVKFIRTMDFQVDVPISNYLTSTLAPSSTNPVHLFTNGFNSFGAHFNGNVYSFNTLYMKAFNYYFYTAGNFHRPTPATTQTFRASPQHSFIGPGKSATEFNRVLYDMDSCVFVIASLAGTVPQAVVPLQLPFSMKGYELKIITTRKEDVLDEITAFLHHPTTNESYVIQFLNNGIVRTVKKIPTADAADIVASNMLEIDVNAGYLIYTKGSEVFGYDYKIGQSLSLLNLGNETITLLRIEKYIPNRSNLPGRVELYNELYKRMVVCTYDPARPTNSGTFRLFQIPLGHQPLVKEVEETGFPKIVDAAFSPIP